MSKDPLFQFWVFCALMCHCVFGLVPPPANVSVVCHNFVNMLYWNYSNAAEPLRFSVLVRSYESKPQTVDTSQTYLDISKYSTDASDDYVVSVTAHAGKEISGNASIAFTYSTDFFNEKRHKYQCSLDFPAVNTSVHKDEIQASFLHPFKFYNQEILEEEFKYTVTYDQEMFSYLCFDDDELCTAEIHLNGSMAGQCIELRFEGKISGIPTYTSQNICVPLLMPETDNTRLIVALIGGGIVVIFVIMGFVWLLCRKWSKMPKVPEVLRSIMTSPSSTVLASQPEPTIVSPTASDGHKPLLSYGSSTIPPDEKDCETTIPFDLDNTELESELPEVDDYNDDSSGFGHQSSDYNSPKFIQEVGQDDFAEGYGPRPPIIMPENV